MGVQETDITKLLRYIKVMEDQLESLHKDVETFAREATEAKFVADETAQEEFGSDIDEIFSILYAEERSNLTPAERLQYAIDLGASPDNIRSFYEGLMIAIGELTEGLKGELAEERLGEIRELIKVYRRYKEKFILKEDVE